MDPSFEYVAGELEGIVSSVQSSVDSAAVAARDFAAAAGDQWEYQAVALSLAGASALGLGYLGSRVLRRASECCGKARLLMPLYDAGVLDKRPRIFRSRAQYESLFGGVSLSCEDVSGLGPYAR